MAMSSATPIQIQPAVAKSIESRPNRETVSSGGDFGSEFKRELNRDRAEESRVEAPTKPAAPEKKVASNTASQDEERTQVQAAAVDPWLAMLQGAAAGNVATEPLDDTASLATDLTDANQSEQLAGNKEGLNVAVSGNSVFDLMTSQAALEGAEPYRVVDEGIDLHLGSIDSSSYPQSSLVAPLSTKSIVANSNIAAPSLATNAKTTFTDQSQVLSKISDAASIAVDAAKLIAPELDMKTAEPLFVNELKSSIATVGEVRPQVTASASQASAKPAEVPVHHISTPVGESRWGDAVAQRVGLMLGRQEQKIEMQLNPPNLGPMEVRLNLAQDQASVVFSSQNAAVREALAAAMPRLTTLLAEQGFTLSNVQVASESLQQHQQQQNQNQNQQAASGSGFNQQGAGRDLGGVYGVQAGMDGEKMQELGPMRLPVAKGGLSLFV